MTWGPQHDVGLGARRNDVVVLRDEGPRQREKETRVRMRGMREGGSVLRPARGEEKNSPGLENQEKVGVVG